MTGCVFTTTRWKTSPRWLADQRLFSAELIGSNPFKLPLLEDSPNLLARP